MTTLEAYLTGDIFRDRADIAAVEKVLHETATTIVATFQNTHWPYEITREQTQASSFLSHSTTAMMIHASDLILNATGKKFSDLGYTLTLNDELIEQLSSNRELASTALLAAMQ